MFHILLDPDNCKGHYMEHHRGRHQTPQCTWRIVSFKTTRFYQSKKEKEKEKEVDEGEIVRFVRKKERKKKKLNVWGWMIVPWLLALCVNKGTKEGLVGVILVPLPVCKRFGFGFLNPRLTFAEKTGHKRCIAPVLWFGFLLCLNDCILSGLFKYNVSDVLAKTKPRVEHLSRIVELLQSRKSLSNSRLLI